MMRLFLFLVLFAFSAQADPFSSDTATSCLVSGYASFGATTVDACPLGEGGNSCPENVNYFHCNPPCVEDNRDACAALGYNESDCGERGGVACPFIDPETDQARWHCSEWTCADGRLFEADEVPEGMVCETVSFKGLSCHKCQCDVGFIDYNGCNNKVGNLLSNKDICGALGYTNLVTSCAEYIACPADANKVKCLDSFGDGVETACIQRYIVPENATPQTETIECTLGGTKEIIVNWECNPGYSQNGGEEEKAAGTATCDEDYTCNVNEFESGDVQECYNSGKVEAGWGIASRLLASLGESYQKQCYSCECTLAPECIYSAENKGTSGLLKTPCCDGVHYQRCVAACEVGARVPSYAVVTETRNCEACGQTQDVQIPVSWACKEGYTLNSAGTACDPQECEKQNTETSFFSREYRDCQEIRPSRNGEEQEGWQNLSSSSTLSGEETCRECRCTVSNDVYKYTKDSSETTNLNYAVYSHFGCNLKYKECAVSDAAPAQRVTSLPEHALRYDSYKICGTQYYTIIACEEGYALSSNGKECVESSCEGYPLTACPQDSSGNFIATCSTCQKGNTTRYRIDGCETVNVGGLWIKYKLKNDQCCRETCNTAGYQLASSCANGLDETLATELNGCGETCGTCK